MKHGILHCGSRLPTAQTSPTAKDGMVLTSHAATHGVAPLRDILQVTPCPFRTAAAITELPTYEQLPSSVVSIPGHVSPLPSIWPSRRQLSAPLALRRANHPTNTYTGVYPLLQALPRCRRSLHHRLRHSGFLASRRPLSILAAASEAWVAAPSAIHTTLSHTYQFNNGARAVPVAAPAAAQVHGDQGQLDQGHAEAGGLGKTQELL
jgi:hypothetical protein